MITQALAGPGATLIAVPRKAAFGAFCLCVAICAITLSFGVKPEKIGLSELITLTLSLLFAGASVSLQLFTRLRALETSFSAAPWQVVGCQGALCPFTGDSPVMRCPRCKTAVAEAAFHQGDKLTKFIVGEDALSWDQAFQACQEVDSLKGRIALDEALTFRGNYYFGTVGSACRGCTTWKRCFQLLPQWAVTLAAMSVAFALVPWAFKGSLAALGFGSEITAVRWSNA